MLNQPISILRRLSLSLAVQTFLSLSLLCGLVYVATSLNLTSRQEELLAEKERTIRHLVQETSFSEGRQALQHELKDFIDGHPELSLSFQIGGTEVSFGDLVSTDSKRYLRSVAFSLRDAKTDAPIFVRLTMDVTADARFLKFLALALIASAIGSTALVSAGCVWLVRRALAPVDALSRQAAQLSPGRIHERLDGRAQPLEISPLVDQFNALLERLERAYSQMESFNADLAHELRTPLANLIGETELALSSRSPSYALNDLLGSNLEELHKMAGIINDMLLLSQADNGIKASTEPIASISTTIVEVMEYHESEATEADVSLLIIGDAPASIHRALFQRAVSNLIANAVRHAAPFSDVLIVIEPVEQEIRIAVCNVGEPVQQECIHRFFDRFYRSVPDRHVDGKKHYGLGLAIVAAIARMHGGRPFAKSDEKLITVGFSIARSKH